MASATFFSKFDRTLTEYQRLAMFPIFLFSADALCTGLSAVRRIISACPCQ
jgi:hypothetical protein